MSELSPPLNGICLNTGSVIFGWSVKIVPAGSTNFRFLFIQRTLLLTLSISCKKSVEFLSPLLPLPKDSLKQNNIARPVNFEIDIVNNVPRLGGVRLRVKCVNALIVNWQLHSI